MYSEEVVGRRLDLAAAEMGWRPEYHSPQEIDDFNLQLERRHADAYAIAKSDAQGSQDAAAAYMHTLGRLLCDPARPQLNADDVRFIDNERVLCMCDAAYFLTRHYWIKNRQNVISRFTFQGGQRVLFDVISEIEKRGRCIEIIVPKARQLGVSTEVEGLVLRAGAFTYGSHSVIASADQDKLDLMSRMMFLGYDRMSWWLRPPTTRRVQSARGMIVFGSIESSVSFQHGSQKNPIAMGSTPTVWHLSEVSSFIDAYNLIEVGLFKAVHPGPRVLGIAESTAKGDGGWFYDTYWHAKANWEKGQSRLMALFLPFYLASDMYPNPAELRAHPVPKDWRPDDVTRKMTAESELYVQSSALLTKVLGSDWRMPREKAHFWEWNYLEARSKGQEKMWFQEMPHTDRACFQGSFDNVFGREIIAQAYAQRKHTYNVYGIVGQSIETRHEPDPQDFDYSLPRIMVAHDGRKGTIYRWELIPLEWEETWHDLDELRDFDAHMGKLFVWLPPERGYDYSIGVDTSSGIGSDATCIAVARRGRSAHEPDVQAAEFRSNLVSHVEAFAWVMAIAAYYGKYMGEQGTKREPYVSVEQVAAVGDTCQQQMRNMGYSRFHKFTRLDTPPRFARKSQSRKEGWFTVAWSRPILTDGYVTDVINDWYVVNSPWTLYEMDHWEVHLTASGKEKKEHASDATDDGIFANAMASFCPNDRRTRAERSHKRIDLATSGLPPIDIGPEGGYLTSTGRELLE